MKTCVGIIDPEGNICSLAWWSKTVTEFQAWQKFFEMAPHKLPIATAKEAYKAIGYRAQRFELVEIEDKEEDEYTSE